MAVLGADHLSRHRPDGRPRRLGIVGTGLIARFVHTYLAATGWVFDDVGLYDAVPGSAAGFGDYLARQAATSDGASVGSATTYEDPEKLLRASDLVLFATTATEPHVSDPSWLAHGPLVLLLSLRDLGPEVMLSALNVVDDVEHCLTAGTSPYLAEQASGHRDFLAGTLNDVLGGRVTLDPADRRPLVFSPFGLGVLDLVVGALVHDTLAVEGALVSVEGFFAELRRHR